MGQMLYLRLHNISNLAFIYCFDKIISKRGFEIKVDFVEIDKSKLKKKNVF